MRPDKKKTRHHDSMKCEAKAKQKAAEKAKQDEKSQKQKNKQQQDKAQNDAKDVKLLDNVESKTSAEENVDASSASTSKTTTSGTEAKYAKRGITSNWTKYEIPSDDEEENVLATGPEFQFMVERSAQVSDHLTLSGEKEWQTEDVSNDNELFALNLKNLQVAVDCIPLYEMLEVSKSEIDVSVEIQTSFQRLFWKNNG